MAQPHISIAAETVFSVGGFPISNSLLATWVVMAILFLLAGYVGSNLKKRPGRGQLAAELIVGGAYSFFRKLGGKHGEKFAPLATSLFLFIVLSNWFGLLPGVGTVGFFEKGMESAQKIVRSVVAVDAPAEHVEVGTTQEQETTAGTEEHTTESPAAEHAEAKMVPLLRGPTADLNTTLALGIVAFFAIQYFGFTLAGGAYAKRFLDIRSPIFFFVGILEALSDISKILSFAFRLFGNVFAGEVLLTIMAFLCAFFLPIPFYGLELFVGVIQGLVFAMLTTVFTSIAVAHGEHMQGNHAHDAHVEG